MPGRLRDPRPSVQDPAVFEALRAERGTQRGPNRRDPGQSPGTAAPQEEWTVVELRRRAATLGIRGRSRMTKGELVAALRDH